MGAKEQYMAGAGDVEAVVTGLREALAAGWDDYVSRHPEGTGYHRLAWLESVARAYGHRGWCVLAMTPNGNLVGVLPLCEFRIPFLGAHWVSLPFCDLGGPLASSHAASTALRAAAQGLVRERGGKGLRLRLPGPKLDEEGAAKAPKVSMLCPLPQSSDALFKSYKPKLRSQIRKAEKNGLIGEVTSSPEAIRAFYPVFAANMHRLGSPVHSLGWFLALQRAYGDQLLVGLVRLENQTVGAGIVLLNGQRACIPWASTLPEYNRLAPNMLLYWQLLEHVTDRGCRLFDFGRSTPDEGTYRFKKQWGAEPHELRWLDLDPDGEPREADSQASGHGGKLRAFAENTWQRLPLPLANTLGPAVRRYISL
ncbi:FemAB-related protein, PEP-CTERM system-associated [Marinobacter daqiaonensis]|uniref:FemAB-related protein, PEP-CTERM system-associated n=1 Tax=Marinobacter daqiaonensis TaxID=650891 RepID=A0A1I6HWM5_9GAMM|nr:FemAB family XrtA/PEP-CTERM system-associated protein [Marinobacter daqiaonensis]SFR58861.1 FemAB-related protein, PEP-CTERM system-associated [Marinobacter daqiaonensis]